MKPTRKRFLELRREHCTCKASAPRGEKCEGDWIRCNAFLSAWLEEWKR